MKDAFGFTQTIDTKTIAYRAFMKMKDGKIGITAWYSKYILDQIIKEAESQGDKLLRIEKRV